MSEIVYTQIWNPMLNAVDPNLVMATVEGDERVGFIPRDDGNKDWIAFEAWLAEGNEPRPATAPETPAQGGPSG